MVVSDRLEVCEIRGGLGGECPSFVRSSSCSSSGEEVLRDKRSIRQSTSFILWIVDSCLETFVGLSRNGTQGRGLRAGPGSDGGLSSYLSVSKPGAGIGEVLSQIFHFCVSFCLDFRSGSENSMFSFPVSR